MAALLYQQMAVFQRQGLEFITRDKIAQRFDFDRKLFVLFDDASLKWFHDLIDVEMP